MEGGEVTQGAAGEGGQGATRGTAAGSQGTVLASAFIPESERHGDPLAPRGDEVPLCDAWCSRHHMRGGKVALAANMTKY